MTSISTVEHFQDPNKGIKEMVRILQKGGILSISVDSLNVKNATKEFIDWHKHKHYVTKYFTTNELIDTLRNLGMN